MIWQEDVFNIILATFLGAAVGLERQLSGKSAGLRTNLLICLGAAIFTIISKRMDTGDGSTTRIAAQIVTGVGFLGAGALIQDRRGVHGLTTAATIWLVASIGVACGAGFCGLAVISTIIAIIALAGLHKLAKPLEKHARKYKTWHYSENEEEKEDFIGKECRRSEEQNNI
ncbi:MAG: MgtC/SapB family protein [Sedimentisphaerales bacterium]|nr:MgtC/SapB family protein [Sedimentisphaerales bacterium]